MPEWPNVGVVSEIRVTLSQATVIFAAGCCAEDNFTMKPSNKTTKVEQ
jgi:hypothetical protein